MSTCYLDIFTSKNILKLLLSKTDCVSVLVSGHPIPLFTHSLDTLECPVLFFGLSQYLLLGPSGLTHVPPLYREHFCEVILGGIGVNCHKEFQEIIFRNLWQSNKSSSNRSLTFSVNMLT